MNDPQTSGRRTAAGDGLRGAALGVLTAATLTLASYLADRRVLMSEINPLPLAGWFTIELLAVVLVLGWGYRPLARRLTPWPAAIIVGLIFGALHLTLMGNSKFLLTLVNLTLLGMFLCRLVERRGTLWMAAGLCVGWLACILPHAFFTSAAPDAQASRWFGVRGDLTDAPLMTVCIAMLLPFAGRLARPWFRNAWGRAAFLVAGVAVTGLAWNNGLRDRIEPRRWGVVVEGCVYRSGQIAAPIFERTLRHYGIHRVIDLTDPETISLHRDVEARAVRHAKMRYISAPLAGDGRGNLESYVRALVTMVGAARSHSPTLVHCQSGAQRVGGVVAMYRLLVERRTPAEACAELRTFGWRAGRDRELTEFLNANMEALARRLVEEKAIEAMPDPLPRLGPEVTGEPPATR